MNVVEKVQGTNHFTNILIYPEYNSLFKWTVMTISWIDLDDRPCDMSTDWCGWKNVLGWKRIQYRELNQNHQDEIDEGNYFKSFHTPADLFSISKPTKQSLCQECNSDNLLLQNCESRRDQNNVEEVCDENYCGAPFEQILNAFSPQFVRFKCCEPLSHISKNSSLCLGSRL